MLPPWYGRNFCGLVVEEAHHLDRWDEICLTLSLHSSFILEYCSSIINSSVLLIIITTNIPLFPIQDNLRTPSISMLIEIDPSVLWSSLLYTSTTFRNWWLRRQTTQIDDKRVSLLPPTFCCWFIIWISHDETERLLFSPPWSKQSSS